MECSVDSSHKEATAEQCTDYNTELVRQRLHTAQQRGYWAPSAVTSSHATMPVDRLHTIYYITRKCKAIKQARASETVKNIVTIQFTEEDHCNICCNENSQVGLCAYLSCPVKESRRPAISDHPLT